MKPWTNKEDKYLATHYAWKGARYVADLLKRRGYERTVSAAPSPQSTYEPAGLVWTVTNPEGTSNCATLLAGTSTQGTSHSNAPNATVS